MSASWINMYIHCCAFCRDETFEYGNLPILLPLPRRYRFDALAFHHSTRLYLLTRASIERTSLSWSQTSSLAWRCSWRSPAKPCAKSRRQSPRLVLALRCKRLASEGSKGGHSFMSTRIRLGKFNATYIDVRSIYVVRVCDRVNLSQNHAIVIIWNRLLVLILFQVVLFSCMTAWVCFNSSLSGWGKNAI